MLKIRGYKEKNSMKELTAWERVEIARSPSRKTSIEYIQNIFDSFMELHGEHIEKL